MINRNAPIFKLNTIVFDFDGVFTDNLVHTNQFGDEMVTSCRSDSFGLRILNAWIKLHGLQVDIFVLSTESNKVVAKRCEKIGIKYFQATENKLSFLSTFFASRLEKQVSPFQKLAYFGNDLNDFEVMRLAEFSLAPSNSHPRIKDISTLVCKESGGHGFVREGIEYLLDLESLETGELSELILNC